MKIPIYIIFFSIVCVCLCLCVSVCCMYVSHTHQSPCLEVREQSLVSALAFHLLWNMVSSFLLPRTAQNWPSDFWVFFTLWLPCPWKNAGALEVQDMLPWGLFPWAVGIQTEVLMRAQPSALPAETSPWPLCNSFLFEVTVGCSYPKQKTGLDYRLQMLVINTASPLWQDASALLDWKMTAIPPHLLRKKKVAGTP